MRINQQPLVSVITPVYNGQEYLAECIESVLKQTYQNFQYTIVNNCSTDHTLEIAQRYAEKDSRIIIHNNDSFLNLIKNWNHAIRQFSPDSKYCKVVHADDKLFPECIELMVGVAEKHPTIGLVGSYILLGTEIRCTGIPYPQELVSGKEICRAAFRGDFTVFGPPTVLLIRSDLIHMEKPFYNEEYFYADAEVCFKVLQKKDFGFVHQILSFVRMHEQSQTNAITNKVDPIGLEFLSILKKYGPVYFEANEFRKVQKKRYSDYYRFLARQYLLRRKKLWNYQISSMKETGEPFSKRLFILGFLLEVGHALLNLQAAVERLKKLRKGWRQKIV